MKLCDLHCDTLTECRKKGEGIARATGHISLERAACLEEWAQVFAVFVPDTLRGRDAANECDRTLDFYDAQREELARHCTPILALENANALNGDLSRLEELARRGVRLVTLTWNGANELGFGARCDPERGLTEFGKLCVRRMWELGMVPDVSHLNEAGFWDVAGMGGRMVASHSCCAALQPHGRNLSDAQIEAVIAAGGLIGLALYPEFLGGAGAAADAARHLRHIIALGGADRAALGSDFDGCTLHPSLAGIEKMPALDEELAELGFSEEIRRKFFWENGANFFGIPAL
ncbi:MAG: membrane dipeptidase [Oscillospiraceae bacterium]|jgi:membrane dipeptidase|nr:membrane dipeptidase [Oscillospiraceae bacterium]